ncbi:MAG: phosphoribosyl-AMP cyclohydrolase [DPANN group archaeon]|nr:phosphoribosyl-AMP cyclohydrolase [DPANN group archaeon]
MNESNKLKISIDDLYFKWSNQFVIGIAQDIDSKDVLMCAFMNREAVEKTIETGYAHYYSTSRNCLWKKGESSGNLQKVIKLIPDCDNDTLLILIKPKGPACHTNNKTCFYKNSMV